MASPAPASPRQAPSSKSPRRRFFDTSFSPRSSGIQQNGVKSPGPNDSGLQNSSFFSATENYYDVMMVMSSNVYLFYLILIFFMTYNHERQLVMFNTEDIDIFNAKK